MKMKLSVGHLSVRVTRVDRVCETRSLALRDWIMSFIADRADSFTVRDFTAWLCERDDQRLDNYKLRTAALAAMKTMTLRGELVIVNVGGAGRGQAYVFRRPKAAHAGTGDRRSATRGAT